MRVISNVRATPTTRIVRVALDGTPYSYRAGQAAALGYNDIEPTTPYSIASAPAETARTGYLEFLVKVDGSSRFGAVVSDVKRESRIFVSRAAGRFCLPPEAAKRPLLFIAGGTGIAPLRSMLIETIASSYKERPALVYSARSPEEFAYIEELRGLQEEGSLDLTLTLTGDASEWRHARGRAGAEHFVELATPRTLCFVCGPPSMVTELPEALKNLGVPADQIRTEDWSGAPLSSRF
jgi:ferredoxin-NADP reductase